MNNVMGCRFEIGSPVSFRAPLHNLLRIKIEACLENFMEEIEQEMNGYLNNTKEEINKAAKRSGKLFDSGFYCAESVLMAIAEAYRIESDLIPKIATGFCSGISRTCGQCGAVSGAIMGLGLMFGRSTPNASVERNYEMVQRFLEMFKKKFGTTNCYELIECDLTTDEGQDKFEKNNLIKNCTEYTEEATRMAMKLIEE